MNDEHFISFHALTNEEVFRKLQTSKNGLTSQEAIKRFEIYGENSIAIKTKFHILSKIFESLRNPFSFILILTTILSFLTGHIIDGSVVLFVLLVNTGIDIYHQKKAHTDIELLKKGFSKYCVVLRDGEQVKKLSTEIVPGDIVFIEEGAEVPADGRIIEASHLQINESSLTGESAPAKKDSHRITGILPIADLTNMAWLGSIVTEGTGMLLVTSTGFKTHFGELNKKLQETQRGSNPFLERIKKLSKTIGLTGIAIVVLFFAIQYGILSGNLTEVVIFSLALLVSIIPESLPTIISIALAKGGKYLAENHAVVKELSTIESVGSTTVVITDKTGTITENSMKVEYITTHDDKEFEVTGFGWKPAGMFLHQGKPFDISNSPALEKMLEFGALSNRSRVYEEDGQDKIIGEPTEAALLILGEKGGKMRQKLLEEFDIVERTRFVHTEKILITIVKKKDVYTLIAIGAPETIWKYSDVNKFNTEKTEEYANRGLRTIAFAHTEVSKDFVFDVNKIPKLSYIGFVAMRDPIREHVKESIKKAKDAGVRVIMATGDHLNTAQHIAEEVGIIKKGSSHSVMDGLSFLSLDEKQQKEALKHVHVFARVTPEVKLLITKILQKNKEVVTMIGDGVNDALALKQADVGIAMGNSGTDAARSASSIILTDDNFTTVIHAIFSGRHIYRNIKQISNFLLSTNASEALVLVITTFLGAPLPLVATQILLLNLVSDGVSSLPFAFKKPTKKILPRPDTGSVLNKYDYGLIGSAALGMTIGTLLAFFLFLDTSLGVARSATFLTLTLTQVIRLLSFEDSAHDMFFNNPWTIKAIGLSFGIIFLTFALPELRAIFNLEILSFIDILKSVGFSLTPFVTVWFYKYITKLKQKNHYVRIS